MNTYETAILKFLRKKGYAVGSMITIMLQETFLVNATTARKILERAVSNQFITSTKPVSFGKGQYAYMPSGSYLTLEKILIITKEHRPPIFRLLSTMIAQGGIISFYEALKVSSSVLDNARSKKSLLEKLISELFSLKLIVTKEDEYKSKYIIFSDKQANAIPLMIKQRGKMMTDAMFIPDILRTLQAINIIDNKNVLFKNKNTPSLGVNHNNHVWDAIAYTRTTGINAVRASEASIPERQTLVVLDILIHRDYEDSDFQGFFTRVQSVMQSVSKGTRKVMPVIVYARINDRRVLNTIHKVGFLTFSIGSIYGERIYEVITHINNLRLKELQGESAEIEKIVEDTLAIVKGSGQEDNLQNIKGDLFESLMYPLLTQVFPNNSIVHSYRLRTDGIDKAGYEYDYLIDVANHKEKVIVELKGYNASNKINLGTTDTRNTVSWFFDKTFVFARDILVKSPGHPKITGCYITSANFSPEALNYLKKLNKGKIKPVYLDTWYNRSKLMQLLDAKGLTHIKSILDKYYAPAIIDDSPAADNAAEILEVIDTPF